jgi:hypothetical protein
MKINCKSFSVIVTTIVVLFLNSCATYTMTREQLYSQIHNADPEQVTTKHSAMIGQQRYMANGVKEIECTDKHGDRVKFPNSPKVEMRITDNRKHKHIFYFDTIILEDSTFTGMNSRILATRKSVRYEDIKKVEVQKGAKAYYYSNK